MIQSLEDDVSLDDVIDRLYQANYRIIYRVSDRRVDILAVYHGSQVLRECDL
ncbi:MAG: hypothetical protein AAF961_19760 [Planctomycetota bacterium]